MPRSATPKWPGPVAWIDSRSSGMRRRRSYMCRRQSGDPLALPLLDDRRGTERQEADHRADLEPRGAAVGQAKDVVVEAVLLVPHAVRTDPVHRPGDQQELASRSLPPAPHRSDRARRARRRSRACSGRTGPPRRCRRPAPDSRRSATARCGRRRRYCRARETRLRRGSCRSGPCDSPTSRNSPSACRTPASGNRGRSWPRSACSIR